MDNLIKELTEHYDLAALGAFLTFLTILFTFYKQVGIPMYNHTVAPILSFFSGIAEAPKRIDGLDSKLDLILNELKPNGGASLKDQLNRLEAHVSISEAQRRLIMDSSPYGILVSDTKGNCTWFNETLKAKLNASDDDLLGDNWINAVHPSDRKKVLEEWENAVEGNRTFNLFYKMIDLDTEAPINVHGIATPAKNFDGSLVGFNGIIYFL